MRATRSRQHISDASDLRKWRTELPNLYDDLGLDPYEFRLVAHYKRVGNCTESVRTTALKCGMSAAQVTIKRRSLAEKGIIAVTEVRAGTIVKVVDVWPVNFEVYSQRLFKWTDGESLRKYVAEAMAKAVRSPGSRKQRLGGKQSVQVVNERAPGERGVQDVNTRVYQVNQRRNNSKKEPIKKEPDKKQQQKEGRRRGKHVDKLADSPHPAVVAKTQFPSDHSDDKIEHYAERMNAHFGIDLNGARELARLPHVTDAYLNDWEAFASRNAEMHLRSQDEGAEHKVQFLGPGYYVKHIQAREVSPILAKWQREQEREAAHRDDPNWQKRKAHERQRRQGKSQGDGGARYTPTQREMF